MPAAPVPSDDAARLADLYHYQVLDTEPEEGFDILTRLAAQIAEVPLALISLTDASRQWFKARVGVSLTQIPRDWAPCAHVVFERQNLVIEDMQVDARFADNPLVTGPPHVRFYAGFALVTPKGSVLGTLAVMDLVPRRLTDLQIEALTVLARQVVDQLELRGAYRALVASRSRERDFEARLRNERMEEAQRLAAELHDGVGQDLVGVSMLLSAFLKTPAAQAEAVSAPILEVTRIVQRAIENCRQVSEGYGGFLVHREGVGGALLRFARGLDQQRIRFAFTGADIPPQYLDDSAAYNLFAIGREAIVNAYRHGHCSAVHVHCGRGDDEIRLVVENDGDAARVWNESSPGMGRSIMEYRARSIGADLRFTPLATGGLRVECRLPCAAPASRH